MKRTGNIFLAFIIAASAYAQTDFTRILTASVRDSSKADLHFERNIYTYLWNLNSFYAFRDSLYSLSLADQFNSSLIKRSTQIFRDENTFAVDFSRRIAGPFSVRTQAESYLLSDNQSAGSQSLGISKAGIHSGVLGFMYEPMPHFSISPLLGVRFDKQQTVEDKGMNGRLYADIDSLDLGGYLLRARAKIDESNLKPRTFRNNSGVFSLYKEFAEGVMDSIRLTAANSNWDFYIPADSNIMRQFGTALNIRFRSEQNFAVQNLLAYKVTPQLSTRFAAIIESQQIDNAFRYKYLGLFSAIPFNTSVQQFRLEGALDLEYITDSFASRMGISVSERDEKHSLETISGLDQTLQEARARQERKLNNTALRTALRGSMLANISSNDLVTFDGSVNLLRYDTPDSLNTDDRDELLITLSLREEHRFSEYFLLGITAETALGHLVYIFKERSANNNWNRIFRIMPETYYQPAKSFRMYNAFEVLANYTVFDFETLVPSVKSYAYRQFAFLDSTSYDITPAAGLDLIAQIKLYERGELRWKEFKERPLQYTEEITFSPQIHYSIEERWYFAVGFRSFVQKKYLYSNNVRQYNSGFAGAGPTTTIIIRLSPRSLIDIRGWKEFQRQSGVTTQEFSNVSMNVRYYF